MKSGRIVNQEFHDLLRECRDANQRRFTVEKIAEGIGSERSHVNRVLLNYQPHEKQMFPGRGGRTRSKIVAFFKKNFPKECAAILAALGWDEQGRIVPRGVGHVAQNKEARST